MSVTKKTYVINYDKVDSVEDLKAILKLMNLTMTIGEGYTPPSLWWDAIERELLIEKPKENDGN